MGATQDSAVLAARCPRLRWVGFRPQFACEKGAVSSAVRGQGTSEALAEVVKGFGPGLRSLVELSWTVFEAVLAGLEPPWNCVGRGRFLGRWQGAGEPTSDLQIFAS